jgi:hypothetical protein
VRSRIADSPVFAGPHPFPSITLPILATGTITRSTKLLQYTYTHTPFAESSPLLGTDSNIRQGLDAPVYRVILQSYEVWI